MVLQTTNNIEDETMANDKQSIEKVHNICKHILLSNSSSGVMHAGSNNFPELWTRDFMYSIRGLSLLGLNKVIKTSYNLILRTQLPSGQVPVLISFRPISPVKKFLHDSKIITFQPKIYPKYRTIFNTLDIDSSIFRINFWWESNDFIIMQKFFDWTDRSK